MGLRRRFKKYSFTKTKKKESLPFKQQLAEEVQKILEEFTNVFVFSVKNIRNGKLKDLRTAWKDSRFILGKNKVMQLGLGKSSETEVQKNIHRLAKRLTGQCGLLYTNRDKEEVIRYFKEFSEPDFARSGAVATETVELKAGPLDQFPGSMESYFRKLGLPTQLDKGVIIMRTDHVVCVKDKPLNPEQAQILKLLGKQMVDFKLVLKCVWSKDGSFRKLNKSTKKREKAVSRIKRKEDQLAKLKSKKKKSKKSLKDSKSKNKTSVETSVEEVEMEEN